MIYSISKSILKLGSTDREVLTLQRLLSQKLGPVSLSGRFDYETEVAVKTFQSRMFLNPDGVVGFLTWQALCTDAPVNMPTLRQGCHGSAVVSIQELLSIDMYYVGAVDGDFGPKLRGAVKRFQADFGLKPDGIVDAMTWRAISEI